MFQRSTFLTQRLLFAALILTPAVASPIYLSDLSSLQPSNTLYSTTSAASWGPVATSTTTTQAFIFPNSTMPSNGTKYLNGGYWPSWKNDESGVCLDLSTITHVSYAFAGIHEDGTIFLENPAGLRAWTERKVEHPELKISLAIGGGHTLAGDRFAAMAANIEMVQRFVTSTKAAVDEYGLDGVDIDWEYPKTAEQGQHYLGLMTDLRAALPKPLKLSTALPAGEWVLQYIPLAELASLVDIVNLMAYDFAGANFANVAFTAHHANLFAPSTGGSNGDSAINYIGRRGFPVNKILLGVPLYGRAFGGANWINEKFSGTVGLGEYPVKDLPKPGMKEFFDDTAIAVFAVGEGQFVTYDNAQSVRKKAAYVKSRGLAGLFFWQLTADRCGEQSLVRAGFEELELQV